MSRLPLIALLAPLAACALPEDNTLTRDDLNAARSDDTFAESLQFTAPSAIPFGAATYNGHIQSEAIVNGNDGFLVLGDLAMTLDISDRAGPDRVSGSINNLNLFDDGNDGFDDQGLGGTLTIAGTTDGGRIDATATGVVDAVVTDTPFRQEATWQLRLDGDVLTSFDPGDTVAGAVTGGTSNAASDDYDLRFLGNGRFYGERE